MEEFKAGDRFKFKNDRFGNEFEILAVNHTDAGAVEYWARDSKGRALTYSDDSDMVKVEPFFEEGKRYQIEGTGIVTAIHVDTSIAGKKYAVLESTNGSLSTRTFMSTSWAEVK